MTYDQVIELVQAAKDNKPLQYRSCKLQAQKWIDMEWPVVPYSFDFTKYEYRIKPREPRGWVLVLKKGTNVCLQATPFIEYFSPLCEGTELVHVVEVLNDRP